LNVVLNVVFDSTVDITSGHFVSDCQEQGRKVLKELVALSCKIAQEEDEVVLEEVK